MRGANRDGWLVLALLVDQEELLCIPVEEPVTC